MAVGLRVLELDGRWAISGVHEERLALVNEFLGYLTARNYSPRTVRGYAFDLLHLLQADWGDQSSATAEGTRYLA